MSTNGANGSLDSNSSDMIALMGGVIELLQAIAVNGRVGAPCFKQMESMSHFAGLQAQKMQMEANQSLNLAMLASVAVLTQGIGNLSRTVTPNSAALTALQGAANSGGLGAIFVRPNVGLQVAAVEAMQSILQETHGAVDQMLSQSEAANASAERSISACVEQLRVFEDQLTTSEATAVRHSG